MRSNSWFALSKSRCRNFVFFLAFFWITSITAGFSFASICRDVSVSLMRTAAMSRVSIVGLVVVLFVPFALSVAAVRFSKTWIIYAVSILKGICFGFSARILLFCYGSAAWLLSVLVLFSDICMLIPLFLFWIRHACGPKPMFKRDVIYYITLAVMIGTVDYWLISPGVLSLMNYS